jgi:NAD(P)-dependent dehydrogenase (short-subunit alcohol dehydrogenase family)
MANDLDFTGQTALITGAGGGLGREYALLLTSRGAEVVVNDLGGSVDGTGASAGAAEKVAQEIRDAGGSAVASTDSVSTPEGAAGMVRRALEEFGKLDILINNAGILRDKSFHNMTEADLDAVIDVHLRGTCYVTLHAWRAMRERSYGRIINTTSNSGLIGNFGQANYGAAKMGIVGLTRVLAIEGARRNIHVNAVAPAAATRMTESLLTAEAAEALAPARVAPVVAWLAHPACETTGEVISAGGGRVARYFIGLTPGYLSRSLTVEDVRDHWEQARSTDGFIVPQNPGEELELFMKQWTA